MTYNEALGMVKDLREKFKGYVVIEFSSEKTIIDGFLNNFPRIWVMWKY